MMSIFDFSKDYYATIISALITAFISYWLFKNNRKDTYIKERYEKVIFPIFILIEPHMYPKEINKSIITIVNEICQIALTNRIYIGGKLLEQIDHCTRELNSKSGLSLKQHIYLCSTISIEYDKSCKKLGIPKRNIYYKINNRQLHPNKVSIIDFVVKYVLWFLVILILLIVLLIITNIINTIVNLIL